MSTDPFASASVASEGEEAIDHSGIKPSSWRKFPAIAIISGE